MRQLCWPQAVWCCGELLVVVVYIEHMSMKHMSMNRTMSPIETTTVLEILF